MSISLTDLPPELLTLVVANVESQATLYNLARSSRHLYHFTIPHLYQSITIREKIREREQRNGHLRNLTSLLIRKPDLARLVRHFTLHTVNSQFGIAKSPGDSDHSEKSEESIRTGHASAKFKPGKVDPALKTAVRAWNLFKEEENDWLRKLSDTRECHHDSVLALLLPALLNVERVVLDLETGHDIYYLKGVIKLAVRKERLFDIRPLFEALTVFVCPQNQVNKKRKHSINLLVSLLSLPAIREISGGFSAHNKNPIKIDSSSSPLTCLDLAAYAVGKADLGQVLRAPKALKTLFYTVCLPAAFESADIHHALRTQRPYLETFSLDYDVYHEDFFALWTVPRIIELDYFKPIKSFNSFNSLRVFKIAALILLTTEYGTNRDKLINFFPPSLELLHLTRFQGRFEGLLEALEHLLASKSSQHISSLRRLILEESTLWCAKDAKLMNVMWRDTQETAMERLSRLAVAQGVSFDVMEAPID